MNKQSNKLAIATFVLAFVGSLAVTVIVLQYAHATAAIAPQSNQTNQTLPNATALIANQTTLANVTASPLNVTILGTNALLNFDPTGFNSNLQIVGEVFNNGTEPINASTFVIPATVYDVNGTIVGESIAFPDLSVIEKNNSSPFKVTFFDTDVKFGVLNALFYKVQTANESAFGTVPPPPPLALGGGVPLGPVPGGVPFGAIPGGPFMGAGPTFPPLPTIPGNLTNKTTPATNQTQGPDESCLFDASQPKCAAIDGECPTDFNMNEDGNCFPQHDQCPDGYHSEEDDETGQCYPDSKSCSPGYILSPDFPTCEREETVCEKHPDLNQCEDYLNKKEAITSQDDNQTSTTDGEEQEEEEQGQGQEIQGQSQGTTQSGTDQQSSSNQQNVEEENTDEE